MNLLSATNLSHSFDCELFSNVSLNLESKESIAIVGMSGSGKSTLLHILSTLLEPNRGTVSILEQDVYKLKTSKLASLKRNELGLVFQSHYLFKGFSAYENLEVAQILSKQKIDDNIIDKLNIKDNIEQKVTELSGGQQQRVSIARVLTKQPRLIFADEPTGNLDSKTAYEVMQLFFEYIEAKDAGMILATHDDKLANMCNKVYKLQNKELIQVK